MEKSHRLLCFDLDGTILDSYREGLRRLLEIARSHNLEVDETILDKIGARWHKNAFEVINHAWPNANASAIEKEWLELDHKNLLPFIDGAEETLKKLRKYFYIGVLTNRSLKSTLRQLESTDGIFDFIYSTGREFYKPDPRSMDQVFQKCQELKISRKHITYVGDIPEVDWRLAKDLKIHFVGILSGVGSREDFINAGLKEKNILNSIANIPEFYKVEKIIPFR